MLDTETKRRIDSCRDILVGKVPDPKSQVEQITIALIYKFMDDMDIEAEELGGERRFFKGEFNRYAWAKLLASGMGGHEMLALYGEAITKMSENSGIPELFRDIFKNAYLPYRDPETLRSFLKEIDSFKYDHSERLGDAFEYLLSVLGSQGDAGQFRTPRHIIDFMVEIANPQKGEVILDPACGTAGFLISSYKHILKHNSSDYKAAKDRETYDEKGVPLESLTLESPLRYKGDLLSVDERKKLAKDIKGYDISPDMVRLSLVNMYLHGFPEPDIDEYDTLTSEERWNDYADVILANPPFMTPKGGIRPHKRFGIPASRSEVLFVDYIAEHLTPSGRAAIVVPEGIIFQSGGAYKQLREMLVKQSLIAVVSLPAGVFNPYSGVKTSILVLDKRLAKKTDNILFVKIENDGYGLGAQRRPIDKNDLPTAVRGLKRFNESLLNCESFEPDGFKGFSLVEKTEIAENGDYNLSSERYVIQSEVNTQYPLVPVDEVFLEINNGINVEQSDEVGKYKVTRIQTIADGTVDLTKTKWTNDEVDSKRFMQKGDILFSHINSYDHLAKTAIYDNDDAIVIHGINLIRFRPNQSKILPRFAAYLFKQDYFVDKARSFAQRAVNQASIKVSDLKTIQIPLPPIDLQREIVAEIEGYQKIINGAKQIVTSYQPRIPINPDWPIVELKDAIKLSSGDFLSSNMKEDGDYPVYGGNGINGTHSKYNLEDRTVVIGRVGAYCGAVHITEQKSWVTDNALYVKELLQPIDIHFLALSLISVNLNQYAKVGGQPSISQSTVLERKIPLPDIDTQKAIVAEIENEQTLVNGNKELVRLFEAKIDAAINRVWGSAE